MDFLENICLKTNDHIKDSTKYNYYFGIKYSNGLLELKHDSEPIKSDVDIKEYDVYVCKTDEINVLTYNVYFKNMRISSNRKNVARFIDNDIDLNLHFIAFQEPAYSQFIINESKKLQKMGKIHWVPGSSTLNARYNTDGLVTGVNTTEMLLFYDKERFELKHYVLGHLFDDKDDIKLKHSRGRPYILGIFEFRNKIENSSPLCFINIHQGHRRAADIILSIDQIFKDINNTSSEILSGDDRHVRSSSTSTIIEELKKCKFILAGDLNTNTGDFIMKFGSDISIKMNNYGKRKPTNTGVVRDHIFSSNDSSIKAKYPPVPNASDHNPVYSIVKPKPN